MEIFRPGGQGDHRIAKAERYGSERASEDQTNGAQQGAG